MFEILLAGMIFGVFFAATLILPASMFYILPAMFLGGAGVCVLFDSVSYK